MSLSTSFPVSFAFPSASAAGFSGPGPLARVVDSAAGANQEVPSEMEAVRSLLQLQVGAPQKKQPPEKMDEEAAQAFYKSARFAQAYLGVQVQFAADNQTFRITGPVDDVGYVPTTIKKEPRQLVSNIKPYLEIGDRISFFYDGKYRDGVIIKKKRGGYYEVEDQVSNDKINLTVRGPHALARLVPLDAANRIWVHTTARKISAALFNQLFSHLSVKRPQNVYGPIQANATLSERGRIGIEVQRGIQSFNFADLRPDFRRHKRVLLPHPAGYALGTCISNQNSHYYSVELEGTKQKFLVPTVGITLLNIIPVDDMEQRLKGIPTRTVDGLTIYEI